MLAARELTPVLSIDEQVDRVPQRLQCVGETARLARQPPPSVPHGHAAASDRSG